MVARLTSVLLAVAALAQAETLPLRKARLEFASMIQGDGPVMVAARNFSFEGSAQLALIHLADCYYDECASNVGVSLDLYTGGNDLPGVADVGDKTFPNVGDLMVWESMEVSIKGTGMTPRDSDALTRTKSYPAWLKATFTHYEGVPLAPVQEIIRGRVTAIVRWIRYEDGWLADNVTYQR